MRGRGGAANTALEVLFARVVLVIKLGLGLLLGAAVQKSHGREALSPAQSCIPPLHITAIQAEATANVSRHAAPTSIPLIVPRG